eukprot:20210-Heterococcus_DN1.PRE.3
MLYATAHGSARCKASLQKLCDAAKDINGHSPMAYGLACIFSVLTISKDELQKEALKDKEITPDQYEQLQKIAESHGQGPKPDPYDADTSDAANTR